MENFILSDEQSPQLQQTAIVTVAVPYRKPGNAVEHLSVRFEVFRYGDRYRAVALCSEVVKRLTALPDVLVFEGQPGSLVGNSPGLSAVAEDIIARLKQGA